MNPQQQPFSLYLHIPFCDVKCSYCAFNIIIGRDDLIPAFTEALLNEMRQLSQPGLSSHTLYLGGGTPSKLPPQAVEAIITGARTHLMLHPEAEITLEANPTRTDRARFAGYRAAGVNRLSLGVQSLHGDQLALYQRTHTTTEAQSTFIAAREAGFTNISLDLIFGAPHQSFAMWQHTVDEAIAWQPEHFSLYSLIFERQTKLTHAVARGELPAPDDDLAADMYAYARHALTHAGYIQYELASFALPGRESAHNQQYWRNLPYLGLGPGAHGYVHPYRYQTVRAVPRYIEAVRGEGAAANFPFTAAHASHEHITEQVAMLETMMLGLRMVREGVSREGFRERFKQGINDVFGDVIPQLKAQGLLMEHGERLLLTEHAYLISNQVFRAFFP